MQDIADESEHDLQSVFNKISESLKSINQEAGEIQGELFSEKESREGESSSSVTDNIKVATCSDSVNITNSDKSVIESSIEINTESSGIDKLVKETALEISNLLNEKEGCSKQLSVFGCLEEKSDKAEILRGVFLQDKQENEPEIKGKDLNCENTEKIENEKIKEIYSSKTGGENVQKHDTENIFKKSSNSETQEKNIYEDLTPSNSGSETQENEMFSSENGQPTDQIDKLKCNPTLATHIEENIDNLQSNNANLIYEAEKFESEVKGSTKFANRETKQSLDSSLNVEENLSKEFTTENIQVSTAEIPVIPNTVDNSGKIIIEKLVIDRINKDKEKEDELLNEEIEEATNQTERKKRKIEEIEKNEKQGQTSKNEKQMVQSQSIELVTEEKSEKILNNKKPVVENDKEEEESKTTDSMEEESIHNEPLSDSKKIKIENDNEKESLIHNKISVSGESLNKKPASDAIEHEINQKGKEKNGAEEEIPSSERLVEAEKNNEAEISENKEKEKEKDKEEPMVISLDDSDEEKIETEKSNDKNEILPENKNCVEDEPMEVETENTEENREKVDTTEANDKENIAKDGGSTISSTHTESSGTVTSDIIINLDDEDSSDEKSSKDKGVDETSVQSVENKNDEGKEEALNSTDSKETNIPTDDINSIEKMDISEGENIQTSNEKSKLEKPDCNVSELQSEKPSEDNTALELNVLENPVESVEKYTFYNKECVNYECKKVCQLYYLAPIFVLHFYKVTIKPNLQQYVCDECYEAVVNKYEEWCNLLETHQPLFLTEVPRKTNEFVEILDSSDEDEGGKNSDNKNNEFSEETIDMIQKELDTVIAGVLSRTEVQNQLTWSKSLLENRIAKIQESSDWINDTLSALQKNADKMNNALYQCPKIEMKILAPLDLNSGKPYVLGESTQANQLTIPPIGEIYRPPIVITGEYFAAKNKVIASWLACTVVEIVDPPSNEKQKNMKYYKVKFFKMKVPTYKSVPAKHLAYADVPKVQLSIGTRVIALFDASTLYKTKEYHNDIKSAFYPGVIAEALQPYNNYRYLIFFDDGYTQYVHHRDVRLICEVSANVWDDIHPGSRDFIQNYLINYKKNRPMVQVKKGQSMVTELNGKWIYAKVVDVDASLIQMLFEGQKNHTEWIYRGSTRLGPLFKAIQKTNIPQVTRLPRRSEPFVRYMQDDENAKQQQQNQSNPQIEPAPPTTHVRSQVARKSTARQESQEHSAPATAVKHLNNSTIFVDDEEPKGTLIYYSSKSENNPPPRTFKPHMCGPHCILREHFEGHYGVLSKPLLNSWERSIYKIKNKKTSVVYRTPCGRNLRSIEEVHKYLRLTRNELNVENFVFDPDVGCLNEYQVKKCIVNKADITEGREKIPIQCVNYYDHTMPPDCEYSADRIPTEGVNLNVDPEFLVGCDCKDDCTDKSRCSCWQLTLEGARYGNPHTPLENIGYYYKRLLEPVTTGIYECNSRCKCSSKCINRVVQHPLETKLQVFKTSNRGWGLRCINDVPKGAFICIYAGNLLTEQRANECGDGDEYFAELDYIEVAERLKEGYESDAQEDIESDEYVPERDSDEEFNPKPSEKTSAALVTTRNRTATAKRSNSSTTNGTNDDDDEQERQAINFVPNTQLENYEEITTKYKSMRRLFGKNEYCYIMDAKSIGNVGRYFNHSCSPNLFVQNVFVDTHDLRFPWVAFFALINIRAGTELTWNYNYEVGVVPGKVLFCQCGAANCRGRLL
ncbi:histone-lysine N-methyltransferase eggless [Condylostylus longicornis]|uniref:histone-lysine N-methyltransferase eggless n=1 Tax=Condylostylus longicornis TaxID=2530218 RepID=UPI00244E4A68|nr:histone-lysine N-methyltransferase eggless [Condylostylus longicornis]